MSGRRKRGSRTTTATQYRISIARVFPSTSDTPAGVGSPVPFPAGSELDPAVTEAWEEQAGDLAPADIVESLDGEIIEAVDIVALKARLAALRALALTEDPGSALTPGETEGFYEATADGGHSVTAAIGYVDGEGVAPVTGTLASGADFYMYIYIRAVRV